MGRCRSRSVRTASRGATGDRPLERRSALRHFSRCNAARNGAAAARSQWRRCSKSEASEHVRPRTSAVCFSTRFVHSLDRAKARPPGTTSTPAQALFGDAFRLSRLTLLRAGGLALSSFFGNAEPLAAPPIRDLARFRCQRRRLAPRHRIDRGLDRFADVFRAP